MKRIILFALPVLAACANTPDISSRLTPYRIDVRQGNFVTQEMVAQLKTGQTKDQVRFILGTPLLADMFHADRWDYVFTIKRPGTQPQRRSIVAWFDGEQLKKLDAPDDVPAEREFVAAISRPGARGALVPLELTDEQRKALPVPANPPQETAPGVLGPARTYPPLEPN